MFTIELTDSAVEDLRHFKKSEQVTILDTIELQLTHEPTTETRNRKPLRPNDLSQWELRIGSFRVFYDVDAPENRVVVTAIGWKDHNKLYIRGQEFSL